ncbi:hypothetical protein PQX77_008950 [Marasmius sp. AFHP31]|nr:hypothetical protein PQX77_011895 [Marasmius sp. AFHP31]KAK1228035.1 hypothetical protein PQX77_008950 [Marasmius sp. AFHP31]
MLCALGILSALLSVCSATRLLSVSISAPTSSDDVTGLEVVTTVTNTGNETLKLLNNPMSVLSKWATDSFEVHNGDGVAAEFNGLFVRYNPEHAVKSNDASEFVVLTPGASFEVAHEVGNFYNFTNAGPGAFTFKPSNIFQAVELDGSLTTIEASVDGVETSLTGKLASSKFVSPASAGGATVGAPSGLQKRATYRSNCSPNRRALNNQAIPAAARLASNAVSHLRGHPSGSALQTTWYGTFARSRYEVTLRSLNALRTAPAGWTYDCSCTDPRKYAYVYKSDYGVVYLCGGYWQVATTGPGSRADTLIHEGTHFNRILGTNDYAYGQSSCKTLARSNPNNAVYNADNHAFFSDFA